MEFPLRDSPRDNSSQEPSPRNHSAPPVDTVKMLARRFGRKSNGPDTATLLKPEADSTSGALAPEALAPEAVDVFEVGRVSCTKIKARDGAQPWSTLEFPGFRLHRPRKTATGSFSRFAPGILVPDSGAPPQLVGVKTVCDWRDGVEPPADKPQSTSWDLAEDEFQALNRQGSRAAVLERDFGAQPDPRHFSKHYFLMTLCAGDITHTAPHADIRAAPRPFVASMVDAVARLHAGTGQPAGGAAHRDIKPENFGFRIGGWTGKRDDLRQALDLLDRGMVQDQADSCEITCGTPGYVAPEVFIAKDTPVWKSDVFSLGISILRVTLKFTPDDLESWTTLYGREQDLGVRAGLAAAFAEKYKGAIEESASALRLDGKAKRRFKSWMTAALALEATHRPTVAALHRMTSKWQFSKAEVEAVQTVRRGLLAEQVKVPLAPVCDGLGIDFEEAFPEVLPEPPPAPRRNRWSRKPAQPV